ncbi:MAG TPA: rhomboid family intramembrane serine protease [Chthoniobacterales bacterium]|nr:rhomboid family intramembrane serine protease [Chthoniobacterales bacterium]
MFGVTTSDDYRPVTWMGRFPIDVTTILVALHVVVAILTCLMVAAGAGAVLNFMLFDSGRVLGAGQIWRLATYAFVHSPSMLLWFAIEMYMLFVFGREVERFIGQRAYIALYALLLFIPSLLLTVWGLSQRTGLAGSPALHFGIFVAFATIYPSAELLLRITAKWSAVILGAIYVLQLLAYNAWTDLAVLLTSIAVGFCFVRLRGVGPELVWWESLKTRLKPKPKFKVVPKPTLARRDDDDISESVDPILDKIARSGIGSLTPNERRILDRARDRLLRESK